MNTRFSIIVSLVVLLVAKLTLAQYHPGEDCHTECEVIYCDYYYNYCDYDCYEVCWGSPESPIRVESSIKGSQHAPLARPLKSGKPSKRMRIQNPSYQVLRNGQLVKTKGVAPKAIALVDTCVPR